jgi:hypothetical protein
MSENPHGSGHKHLKDLEEHPGNAELIGMLHDSVNSPKHYTQHNGVECIDITENMSFNAGNAMKYLWRHNDKGAPVEDLRKARWYLDREIKRLCK